MKSYLVVWFNSEGSEPSEVTQRLLSLGFKPIKGNYDYVYEWQGDVSVDEVLSFADKVSLTLEGTNVLFKIETVDNKN